MTRIASNTSRLRLTRNNKIVKQDRSDCLRRVFTVRDERREKTVEGRDEDNGEIEDIPSMMEVFSHTIGIHLQQGFDDERREKEPFEIVVTRG